jgi:hypothetical protein
VRASPSAAESSALRRVQYEAKLRSIGVSNVLSSLACVAVSALKSALHFSLPTSAWALAASFLVTGAASATLLDCLSAEACAKSTAAKKRCARIAEVQPHLWRTRPSIKPALVLSLPRTRAICSVDVARRPL